MTNYLTAVEVLAMHAAQVARYGGSAGIRDMGMLEAALYRPQTGYYADVIAEGAALWESLSQNHPFVDGNKRTAFDATYSFLRLNGIAIVADAVSATLEISAMYETGRFTFENLEPWLRANTQQL